MAVSWTEWQPGKLRRCWHDGTNLKPSCTTASYSGGNPAAATELKSSIVDLNGNLREGLVHLDALKPSIKPPA